MSYGRCGRSRDRNATGAGYIAGGVKVVDGEAFTELPPVASWRLRGAYDGFEVVRFSSDGDALVLEGTTVGNEQGVPWTIHHLV
jgi:hypothetical protein